MIDDSAFDSTLKGDEVLPAESRRVLIVISPDGVTQRDLSGSGELVLGRDPKCDVVLPDRLISREHARLRWTEDVQIEDLGSANGTKIGAESLEPGQPKTVTPGQPVELGSSLLVLQRSRNTDSSRRLRSHVEFEAHLEEVCKNRRPNQSVVLLRVRVLGEAPVEMVQEILTEPLGARDAIGAFAPGEYELLLVDTEPLAADTLRARLEASFEAKGFGANVGMAACPTDGSNADALVARAGERLTEADREVTAPLQLSPAMRDLYTVVERVATSDIGVLFQGDTGVGKRVVAEALHHASPRRDGPFVPLNCAALAEQALESELFGHEKDAFPGAAERKIGVLQNASGGTVLLQEVGALPPSTQGKLLRVIESRQIFLVGGTSPLPVNVRIVATSQADLDAESQAGRFREDLYYRLAAVALRVPSLRERPEEVVPLAERFIRWFAAEMGRSPPVLGPNARRLLERYGWPGNVRELRNTMERAVLLCPEEVIEPEHLPLDKLSTGWTSGRMAAARDGTALPAADEDPEKVRILEALRSCGGNQTKAAARLGVSRRTLTKWLNRYADIPRPRK